LNAWDLVLLGVSGEQDISAICAQMKHQITPVSSGSQTAYYSGTSPAASAFNCTDEKNGNLIRLLTFSSKLGYSS